MAKAGKVWTFNGRKYRYYYPNSPSKKGRYRQELTHKGWSRLSGWDYYGRQ